jgi:phage-related baseplate assembly protein
MPRTFSLISARDPSTLVARARRAAMENDADFRGNEASGSFSASGVKGAYRMDDKVVAVTITEKPFYVPWSLVESELKRLLG